MAYRHGRNTDVLLGSYDISAYLNEANSSMSIDTAETSAFGSSAKTYIVGQNDATVSLSGMFDGDATAVNAVFESIIDNDLTPAFTIAYDGGLGVGNDCSIGTAKQTSYEITAPVGDVVAVSGELQVTGGIRQGILLNNGAALSATTDGTSVDGTAATTIGAIANLHVIANSRSTASTIKVQHSTDNSTWVDLITFTSVPATTITNESIAAGVLTIRRYLRMQVTLTAGTGSITPIISIARRN
jgi:hypothetical protein